MYLRIKPYQWILIAMLACVCSVKTAGATEQPCVISPQINFANPSLTKDTIAEELGWISQKNTRCGGYYLDDPFTYPEELVKRNLVQITSTGPALYAKHGTSTLQGNVTISQIGEQIKSNRALLYRDPVTGKLSAIDLVGDVHLREPNTLVIAKVAHVDLITKMKSLKNILYRTGISTEIKTVTLDNQTLQESHPVTELSAWGQANELTQAEPKIYELQQVSYSTCPPDSNVWEVRASSIVLNKNTGRGVAKHARLYIKRIPVFYTPYLNFPIDKRRETGFLPPSFTTTGQSGAAASVPFYWNLAPNYDTTITPTYYAKRNWQLTNLFRYLTPTTNGRLNISALRNDKLFSHFQTTSQEKYQSSADPYVLANLNRLESAGSARGALSWQNNMQFNEHWTSGVDYNYVTDDYYLRDLRNDLNEVTDNQLLQQASVSYKSTNWNFMTRLQQYQTLHPVDETAPFQNQYSRFPQVVLNGDYPNQRYGLDYFISNDVTHFDLRDTPGSSTLLPMGNRTHIQPGVSLPFNLPYFYVTPRVQMSFSQYELGHVSNNSLKNLGMALPIIDVGSGMYFDRDVRLFGFNLRQTLEPQVYYTYVPYHNQTRFPLFDTTLNTLTYDQLFTYNRFSGLDRLGDANQVAVGLTTRFLDADSGYERIRAGIGQLFYFRHRVVTLCTITDTNCPDATTRRDNKLRRSPISGTFTYTLNPHWSVTGNTIWNVQTNNVDNQSANIQYSPDSKRVINLGYNFVRQGDLIPGTDPNSNANSLKQADLSFAWPVLRDWSVVGRATKSINRNYFQNLIFGLQYDSCCWAVRLIGGRTFTNLDPNSHTPQYNPQIFLQFALRGLGNFGSGDPSQFLSSNIGGYNTNFGQLY